MRAHGLPYTSARAHKAFYAALGLVLIPPHTACERNKHRPAKWPGGMSHPKSHFKAAFVHLIEVLNVWRPASFRSVEIGPNLLGSALGAAKIMFGVQAYI